MRQPVLDETGLDGIYDFNVNWTGPEPVISHPGSSSEFNAHLIAILRDQFGLELTGVAGPVEYWVVDHVDSASIK